MSKELKPCPFCGAPVTVSIKGKLGVIMCPVGTGCVGSGLGNFFNADQQETACAAWNTRAPDARLAAAEAERDAAIAAMLLAGKQMVEFGERSHSEGEARATAAIVALINRDPFFAADSHVASLLDMIERGDHLKGTSNE